MKKLFLIFALSSSFAMAEVRKEIIIGPDIYIKEKKDVDSDQHQIEKNVIRNGIKVLFETKESLGSDTELGGGMGIIYNPLKVKGKGINSESGNMFSVPLYLTFGGGADNGIYSKLSLGVVLRNGNVKWTDSNGGRGEIKVPTFGGYAAFGVGVRKDKFSVGLNVSTSTKGKRTYSSPTKSYSDKLSLSNAVVSLDFGYAYKFE